MVWSWLQQMQNLKTVYVCIFLLGKLLGIGGSHWSPTLTSETLHQATKHPPSAHPASSMCTWPMLQQHKPCQGRIQLPQSQLPSLVLRKPLSYTLHCWGCYQMYGIRARSPSCKAKSYMDCMGQAVRTRKG